MEEGQLASCLGLLEHRTGFLRDCHRGAEPILGDCGAAALPENHPDHPIGARLRHPDADLLEHVEGAFRQPQRRRVVLAAVADLGAPEITQGFQAGIAGANGVSRARREKLLRLVEPAVLHSDQPEVAIDAGEAGIVTILLEGCEGASKTLFGLVTPAPDARDNAEILGDSGTKAGCFSRELQGRLEPITGGFEIAGFGVETAERIKGLSGKHRLSQIPGFFKTPMTEDPGLVDLVPTVSDDGKTTHRFDQHRPLLASAHGGDADRLLVRGDRVFEATPTVVRHTGAEQHLCGGQRCVRQGILFRVASFAGWKSNRCAESGNVVYLSYSKIMRYVINHYVSIC